VTGQAPPFLFNFNRGAGFTSSNSLNGLPAAIYQIQVQDNNGCITDVTVPLGEIDIQLDPDFNPVTPPSCFGYNDGRLEIRILGGEPPFAYKWRPNEAFRMADTLVDNVSAGTYIVEVRDGFNCLGFVHIAVPQPEELVVNIDTTNISCFGEIDGALAPLVFGGTGAYQYSWSTGVNDSVAQELPTGQYGVTVTDANGCQTLAGAFIAEPPRIDIVIDSTRDVICFGDATGSIFYRGAGGSPPFTYSIDGANFTEGLQFDNLPAGSYNLTIKDGRGCTRSVPTEIFQPAQLIVNAGNDTVVDLGFSTQLLATHQPLGKPVLHQWTPGESLSCQDCPSPIAGPLQSTTYLVTIIDDSGCTATDQVEVLVFLNRPVYVPNSFTPNGDGLNDRLTVFGGPSAQSVRKIQIYDRWGELVFEGKNLSLNDEALGWDGRHNGQLLNPGVFVYVAEIEFIDNSILEFEGDFTLLR
jgi:gliding motility-associated-like protein